MLQRLSVFLLWAVVLLPVFTFIQQSNATSLYHLHAIHSRRIPVCWPFAHPDVDSHRKVRNSPLPRIPAPGTAEVIQTLSRERPLSFYLIFNTNTTDALDAVSTQPRSTAMNPYNSTAFQSVVSTHTLAIVPDDLEVFLVPGGLGTRAPDLNVTIDWVRVTYPKRHSLISVCTGGSIVAREGASDGRHAMADNVSWNQTILYGTGRTLLGTRWRAGSMMGTCGRREG